MRSGSDLPSYRTLLVDVDRGVATLTLNRPRQRNAVGDGMRETQIHLDLMRLDDAKEGVRAFLEHRPPRWTGE